MKFLNILHSKMLVLALATLAVTPGCKQRQSVASDSKKFEEEKIHASKTPPVPIVSVPKLTENAFREEVLPNRTNEVYVVRFHDDSRMTIQTKEFLEIAQKYPNFKFRNISFHYSYNLRYDYGINYALGQSTETIILFQNGKPLQSVQNSYPSRELVAVLKSLDAE